MIRSPGAPQHRISTDGGFGKQHGGRTKDRKSRRRHVRKLLTPDEELSPNSNSRLALLRSSGDIRFFLLSISAAVTFTILLVSGNTMAMSVRERIKEVGVLKTLGFTQRRNSRDDHREAVTHLSHRRGDRLISGGRLAVGGREGRIGIRRAVAQSVDNAFYCGGLVRSCILLGLLSSFIPAWNAARTNILDSLRFRVNGSWRFQSRTTSAI